ncbi:purine hydroxylase delta subunit apoprotein [Orenia metallireducens]|uniref:Purine hydroxylase delta subunit apoprotein n=1 Tax=Orenia metallireducens TaxID=1413210 RepID=A0A285GJS1_9FIRM|nr:(2Fe-2S)-binding protein [Orenia metallireducens]PRX30445.1 purine hydroxylase delta subunit apoprotein [Orenia metallireducens]SNY22601.1 purine hydroxylase delta subunit apoprotein [Orenia metallireducens]
MGLVDIKVKVNGEEYKLQVAANLRLVDLLRDKLGLIGTKEGCGEGECGACTVIIDGETANSCLVLAAQVDGSEITTIEALGNEDKLHPLQQSFIDNGAVQCGFCTPGMILSAKNLLDHNPQPSEEEIKRGLSGNICRCTGYTKIIKAVQDVAQRGDNHGN